MHKCIYIFFLIFVLSSCTQTISVDSSEELSSWPYFSVRSEIKFKEKINRPDNSMAFTTYDTNSIQRAVDDVAVYLFPNLSSDCKSEATGILPDSQLIHQLDGIGDKSIWGPVDTNLLQWQYDYIPQDSACTNPAASDGGGGYGLCSKKGNRVVLICISQMKDDPKMAEEIFKTFRWTD